MSDNATESGDTRSRLQKMRDVARGARPGFDRHIGLTQQEVIESHTSSLAVTVLPMKNYVGELYVHLKVKHHRNPDELVMQLRCQENGRVKIFWLVKKMETWRVICDIAYPVGLQF